MYPSCVRTLVLGLPLPSADFDNYTFLSAPSIGEYSQVVADMASLSRAVDDVIHGTGVHTTYGGQAIVNGAASSHAFSLRSILDMRRRETQWLVSHGGLVVLFGFPEIAHAVADAEWRSYSWLPGPDDFSFADDLLPGFGKAGAVATDSDHPFAPFIQTLAMRLAYRVYIDERNRAIVERGHVFARSPGGVAIAFDIPLGEGRLVVLPPLLKPEEDRAQTAQALAESLGRWNPRRGPQAVESQHPREEAGKEAP